MRIGLNVLVAPSGFKGSLDPASASESMVRGVRRIWPSANISEAPLIDGGEGFVASLVAAARGRTVDVPVSGPTGRTIQAKLGLLKDGKGETAVVEIAQAAGLSRVPSDARNPMWTTSRGVGELIAAALDRGVVRIVVGCGDSGVNDAGVGMATALGARFLDRNGQEIGTGGAGLLQLDRIDLSGLDRRLAGVAMDVAVNAKNALLGEEGVTRRYGPQKGASPSEVDRLEAGMQVFARIALRDTGCDVARLSGAGASGGLGAGLASCLGASLVPREVISERYMALTPMLMRADLVITGEGSLDGQSTQGKMPCIVASRARSLGIPVVAIAGTLGPGADETIAHGVDAYSSLIVEPCSLEHAIGQASTLLEEATARALSHIEVGMRMENRRQCRGTTGPGRREAPSLVSAPRLSICRSRAI